MCEIIEKPKFPKLAGKIAEIGATYSQVAVAIGMTPSMFSKRMSGEIDFDLSEVLCLMDFLGSSFDDLFSQIN